MTIGYQDMGMITIGSGMLSSVSMKIKCFYEAVLIINFIQLIFIFHFKAVEKSPTVKVQRKSKNIGKPTRLKSRSCSKVNTSI